MRPSSRRLVLAGALVTGLVAGVAALPLALRDAPAAGPGAGTGPGTVTVTGPRLTGRATLPADRLGPVPPEGQLPGLSGAVAEPDGTLRVLPDSGREGGDAEDVELRIDHVRVDWGGGGAPGALEVLGHVRLSDPDRHLGSALVDGTPARRLTGADLDVGAVQRAPDGSFWLGDARRPSLLHVDADGRVLQPPVRFPPGSSPQQAGREDEGAGTAPDGGFEAVAASPDGHHLYPVLAAAPAGEEDPRRRLVAELDTRTGAFTDRTWTYRVDTDANRVADAQMTGSGQLLVLERDDLEGAAAVTRRLYTVDLGRTEESGVLAKELHADLLAVDDPDGTAGTGAAGAPDQPAGPRTAETFAVLPDGQLAVAGAAAEAEAEIAGRPGTPGDLELLRLDPDAERWQTLNRVPVLAHRGASGQRPEHTLAAYALAIRQCADVIEPDVVPTRDGVLVARHENEISGTTDVASRPEFADRRTTRTIDGRRVTGWFTEDFTLAELRTLRAVERVPDIRPENTRFDGLYPVPTLAEVLDLARHSRTCAGEPVGVAPETKHPSYFDSIGLSLEEPLLAELAAAGLDTEDAPVVVQSFETANLRELARRAPVGLAQLVGCSGAPQDLAQAGDGRTYRDLVSPDGLREIATYADSVALCKDVMIPRQPDGTLGQPTAVVEDAHRAGLTVVGWSFRVENEYLPAELDSSADPAADGDMAAEVRVFLDAGMDQVFSDNPDVAVAAVAGAR
ncbi:glycerophosphodiester phosphodiesterase [Auraticoccus sp. F435]|uniref:glycerophosphodiester phosphodiesterase n=1 Tax=Auraticoccus cholistanensis TaxID=2656650 RepID=A0A6A9UTA2_9ACTN|nr:esterase-like activity of phytase family protein [Auraticoccus cholistanensis]MVA74965.1 glycerophosphodiester phosphodiesterase [Auraticoccus cholistanensis]